MCLTFANGTRSCRLWLALRLYERGKAVKERLVRKVATMSIFHVRFSCSITLHCEPPRSEPEHAPELGPRPKPGATLRDTFEALAEEAIRIVESTSGIEFERAVQGYAARVGRDLLLPASIPFECGYNLGAIRKITSTANGTAIQCDHACLWLAHGSVVYVVQDGPKAGKRGVH